MMLRRSLVEFLFSSCCSHHIGFDRPLDVIWRWFNFRSYKEYPIFGFLSALLHLILSSPLGKNEVFCNMRILFPEWYKIGWNLLRPFDMNNLVQTLVWMLYTCSSVFYSWLWQIWTILLKIFSLFHYNHPFFCFKD